MSTDTTPSGRAVFGAQRGMWTSGTGDTSGFSQHVHLPQRIIPNARPYGGGVDEIVDKLHELVPDLPEFPVVCGSDMPTFYIPREFLVPVARALRDDHALRYESCSGVSGVHYPDDEADLHAVYHLLSMTHHRRLRLEVMVPTSDPHIPSVVSVYPTANYHERETWDMFGIIFDGHPGLTRILMPDDWEGHPQRKDYALGGVPVEFLGVDVRPVEERRHYR